MVTISTSRLEIKNLYVLPTECVRVLYGFQTAIIDTYNINRSGFLTQTLRVYWAVRTESLHIIQPDFRPQSLNYIENCKSYR